MGFGRACLGSGYSCISRWRIFAVRLPSCSGESLRIHTHAVSRIVKGLCQSVSCKSWQILAELGWRSIVESCESSCGNVCRVDRPLVKINLGICLLACLYKRYGLTSCSGVCQIWELLACLPARLLDPARCQHC